MALHTRKQFAELCGIENVRQINSYISRGTVVASGKYIDDTIQENKNFLIKKQAENGVVAKDNHIQYEDEIRERKPKNIDKQIPEKKPRKEPAVKEPTEKKGSLYELEVLNKTLDAEKKEVDIEIAHIKKDKMRGQYIEFDVVLAMVVNNSESCKMIWESTFDSFIIKFAGMNKLTGDQISVLKKEFVEIANQATVKIVENNKKMLRKVRNAVSEEKGVGERE